MNCHFKTWRDKMAKRLRSLKPGFHPKELFVELSEGILAHYEGKPLLDRYDVYQHFTDYWATTMQDDAYLIAADGWKAETYRIVETKKGKDGKPDKTVDRGWTCDLIPKILIVARYYAAEQDAIDKLAAELESVTASIEELEEEEGGGEGGLAELVKVNRSTVTSRLKEIKDDLDATEERAVLRKWLELNDRETKLKKDLKDAEAALDKAAYERYPKLDEAEVKTLVVQDKWMAAIHSAIRRELESISHSLTQRVSQLAERYAYPFAEISTALAESQARVDVHLKQMGFGA